MSQRLTVKKYSGLLPQSSKKGILSRDNNPSSKSCKLFAKQARKSETELQATTYDKR